MYFLAESRRAPSPMAAEVAGPCCQPVTRIPTRLTTGGTGARRAGGDDFGEFFDPKEDVFARILHGTDDLMLPATTTHLASLEVV